MSGLFENIGRFIGHVADNLLLGGGEEEKQNKIRKEKRTQPKRKELNSGSDTINNYPQNITVALHLVVSASVVRGKTVNSLITASEIEKLIDDAPYFLCTVIDVEKSIESYLSFTDDDISKIHDKREFYIRIIIADGQDMLDKKVPYILKRNLPAHGQGVIRKLACLEDLSGLEKFNRV
jgi:hypothetical protein